MSSPNPYQQTLWLHPENEKCVQIIDQRHLPHELVIEDLDTVTTVATAIRDMHLRGAPLIGVAAAYGLYLAAIEHAHASMFDQQIIHAARLLKHTRPTAINLAWAIDQQLAAMLAAAPGQKISTALSLAQRLRSESIERCRSIGEHGLPLLQQLRDQKGGKPVNILTHCNAGWLACIEYGTATAPIYLAQQQGMDVHVWVDETRPRNQGARLTAWELAQAGVPHTIIADNTGGHLMQSGQVDCVIVGSDRTTCTGDVANKIGTYLKALAAHDNGIPFYVALPSSSIDWKLRSGLDEIPVEQRSEEEVKYISGLNGNDLCRVLLSPAGSPAANYAFDITPARLVTALITERGVCQASEQGLRKLFGHALGDLI